MRHMKNEKLFIHFFSISTGSFRGQGNAHAFKNSCRIFVYVEGTSIASLRFCYPKIRIIIMIIVFAATIYVEFFMGLTRVRNVMKRLTCKCGQY